MSASTGNPLSTDARYCASASGDSRPLATAGQWLATPRRMTGASPGTTSASNRDRSMPCNSGKEEGDAVIVEARNVA